MLPHWDFGVAESDVVFVLKCRQCCIPAARALIHRPPCVAVGGVLRDGEYVQHQKAKSRCGQERFQEGGEGPGVSEGTVGFVQAAGQSVWPALLQHLLHQHYEKDSR